MPKQALNLKFFRDISWDTKRIKDNPESSQGTFLHFTCNYILKDNQISEQEPEHNCLLPPWHIPCESRVHLPLASLWPQDLDTAGCPTTQLHQEGRVVPQLEHQAAQQLSPMAGKLERLVWISWGGNLQTALTSWLTALSSSYYAKCEYLQNMQSLSFLQSNSCSVTKLSSGKAEAGSQMHQDTYYETMI